MKSPSWAGCRSPSMMLLLTVYYCFVFTSSLSSGLKVPCQQDKLVVYKVIFATYWDEKTFPRQYPEWRPPAQWSKLVGKLSYTSVQSLARFRLLSGNSPKIWQHMATGIAVQIRTWEWDALLHSVKFYVSVYEWPVNLSANIVSLKTFLMLNTLSSVQGRISRIRM